MAKMYFNSEFIVKVLGNMLGTIDGAVLTAGATETYLKIGETSFNPTLGMEIDNGIDMREELKYLAVLFKEVDDGTVKTRKCLVLCVTTRVVRRTAVKDVTATIAGSVFGNAFLEGEGIYSYNELRVES